MKKSALIFTIGQQDVQVLVNYEGKKYLAKPSKDFVHEFTEKLSNEEVNFQCLSIAEYEKLLIIAEKEERELEKLNKKEFIFRKWADNDNNQLDVEINNKRFQTSLIVVFPMIYKAIRNIRNNINNKDYSLSCTYILYTERGKPEEPVGVAEILRPVLMNELGFESDDVVGMNMMSGFKYYDAYSEDFGQTLKPEIANTIYNMFKNLKYNLGISRVFVSHRSGIPKLGDTIKEAATLIFDDGQFCDVSSNNELNDKILKFCPIETLKTGRKIKRLIRDGNLEGGLSLASVHFHYHINKPIVMYLDLINSILVNGRDYILDEKKKFLETKRVWPIIKEFFFYSPFAGSIRAAFRTEHYLMRKDYVNALKNIFTIVDAASWESIENKINTASGDRIIDSEARTFNVSKLKCNPTFSDIFVKYKNWENPEHSFSKMVTRVDNNQKVYPMDILLNLLNVSNLCRMRNIIRNTNSSYLRNVRNGITHGSINYSNVMGAIEVLLNNNILYSDGNPGYCFLKAPIVADVLKDFDKRKNYDKEIYKAFCDFHRLMLEDIEELIFEE